VRDPGGPGVRRAGLSLPRLPAAAALAALLAAAIGCGGGGLQRYGILMGEAPAATVAELLAAPERNLGRDVAVRGVVAQVCREMGCWFEIADGGRRLMVDLQMGRHFTVPAEIAGRQVLVEGTFVRDEGVLKLIGHGVEVVPGPAG
jgi:hypothetical protein